MCELYTRYIILRAGHRFHVANKPTAFPAMGRSLTSQDLTVAFFKHSYFGECSVPRVNSDVSHVVGINTRSYYGDGGVKYSRTQF